MKLGDRLNHVLAGLLMLPEVRAVDPTMNGYGTNISQGKGGHGTHKARGAAPSGTFAAMEDQPAVLRWADRFDRMIQVAERELAIEKSGAESRPVNGDTRSPRRKSENRVIIEDYIGMDPIDVGFIFRKSTEAVRKLRLREGRDPDTGEVVRRDVLTPSPRNILNATTQNHEEG